MKRVFELRFPTLVLFCLCTWPVGDASARVIPTWTYEDLFSKSDVVVIADPLATTDSGEESDLENPWKVRFVGVNTEVKIKYAIKGTEKNEKIVVTYYRLPDSTIIKNGPELAHISLTERTEASSTGKKSSGKPEYLLFLRKRKDGVYEPVSGLMDSSLSIRELTHGSRE